HESKERTVFSDAERIPVHLISGFLGSGKTTFLQRLLDHCVAIGLKPAVMMNEYGEVNIDGELLRGQGYSVREMTNGCICCTIGGTLGLALQEVATLKPDVIFIEATGLADPVELIDQVTKEDVLPLARLASLVAVLDPVNFARLAEQVHSGIRQQTELADFVLINKRDLADERALEAVATQVRVINPRAEIVMTQWGEMNYNRLLGKQGEVTRPVERPGQTQIHDHFHTLTVLCEAPLVRERFTQVMRALPPAVWRAKGFVRFSDSDEQWMVQYVAGDLAMEWIDLLPEPPEHLVFIGQGFDREALRATVLDCALQ
ncbi:MAG: CobW family GTP-binding protein, partial [Candidatus Binatia bacterium]